MFKEGAEVTSRLRRETFVTKVYTKSKASAMKKKDTKCWTEFIGVSTCAAVARLGDKSAPPFVKVVWKITLIIGIVLTAVFTYFSTISFMDIEFSRLVRASQVSHLHFQYFQPPHLSRYELSSDNHVKLHYSIELIFNRNGIFRCWNDLLSDPHNITLYCFPYSSSGRTKVASAGIQIQQHPRPQ